MSTPPNDLLHGKINLETSHINWHELQTVFARGQVVRVSSELDLVEVAIKLSEDDKNTLESWMTSGHVGEVDNETAKQWYETKKDLWAVVVRPWVLVQDSDSEQVKP
ncbi:MAG: DUF2288 domain-containing protein [Pseudomonadales bacterium]|nr:DUF2288 domain-containing protein [Pseudomonadales bacterium]